MVADLYGDKIARVKCVDAWQQIACALFDLAESPEHCAARSKNGGYVAFSRKGFLPRL
jgi:hypothetical protein